MNKDDIKQILVSWDIDPESYIEVHNNLSERCVDILSAEKGENWGDLKRVSDFSLVLRQINLHRALFLFEGALEALSDKNSYSMILCIRGNIEATASLGYLHYRLTSLKNGNLTAETVDKDINTQILAVKDSALRSMGEAKKPLPINIMKMLDYTDKSVCKAILRKPANSYQTLRDPYELLCEFCHPNFLSNSLSFQFKPNREVHFRHQRNINQDELNLLRHVVTSSFVFIELFDDIDAILKGIL